MTGSPQPVCVVGAGTMGRGIAQIALAAGHPVTLVDQQPAQLTAAREEIVRRLSRAGDKAVDSVRARLRDARSVHGCDPVPGTLVIEAVVERLQVKHQVLGQALEHFGDGSILATNTSSLSVTEIAAGVARADRVVGMHFFNPVPVMRLVEVVSGLQTGPEVAAEVAALARAWGKEVALVRSAPGFVVNRVARAFYGEALRLVEEGVASPECVDEVARGAGGFRMGPFELMDLIGVEVNHTVTRTVWEAFNFDPRFAPSLLQAELVAAGRFGRKAGRGFYDYAEGARRPVPAPRTTDGPGLTGAVLVGHDAQLEALVRRAALPVRHEDGDSPALQTDAGKVVVTRGLTAAQEAAHRGVPVVVLDRWLDLKAASCTAMAGTDDALLDRATATLGAAGVRAFQVADAPGLVLGRVLPLIANEAWEAARYGVASPEDIDRAMRLGTNYPSGPFDWGRQWGEARLLELLDNVWSEYRDPRYRAGAGLRARVRASG